MFSTVRSASLCTVFSIPSRPIFNVIDYVVRHRLTSMCGAIGLHTLRCVGVVLCRYVPDSKRDTGDQMDWISGQMEVANRGFRLGL